jgi:hypothetical protein
MVNNFKSRQERRMERALDEKFKKVHFNLRFRRKPEEKSLIPSTWPALEEHMRLFIIPGFCLRKDLKGYKSENVRPKIH